MRYRSEPSRFRRAGRIPRTVARMRILAVDDEPGILRALTRLFKQHGHEIRTAASGTEAEGMLAAFEPEVVISDFKMPGMNGIELLRIVAARLPQARRILLTGYADIDAEPGVMVIAKPYVSQLLLEACQ